ncbi:hypothetical protein OAK97_01775 [bacterium]|nr:hypothetical protein [bacterium]
MISATNPYPGRNRVSALITLVTLSLNLLKVQAQEPGLAFFENRIRPILALDDYECQSSNGPRKGGLAIDHQKALLEGVESGPAIIPGESFDAKIPYQTGS